MRAAKRPVMVKGPLHRGQRAGLGTGVGLSAHRPRGTAWAWSSTPIPSTPTMIGNDGISCDFTDRDPAPSAPHRRHWAMRSPARPPCTLSDQGHGDGDLVYARRGRAD